ncbi:MAG: biopolymer transporter ExbD [Lentisphaeraceae bacterium]|nr:biopolymer transporter ExbD [Lentisphaeraceae bacterium]
MIKSKNLKIKVPISSMIDIVFLMIFFFVVSSTMDPGLNETIDLVKVDNLKPKELPPNKVYISVNKDGDILLENGFIADGKALDRYLVNILNTWGDSTKFIVRADKDALHKDLDAALRHLKGSGARNIVVSGEKN